MSAKNRLRIWVVEALDALGGSAHLVEVSRTIWEQHEADLRASGNLFFTWQYDVRWAAQTLRDKGVLTSMAGDRSGVWSLVRPAIGAPSVGGTDWSGAEIERVVSTYMGMLGAEMKSEPYVKAVAIRSVSDSTGRSRGSVEFKFANISAVLDEMGLRFVAGYKPRPNYQAQLRAGVADFVRRESMTAFGDGLLLVDR
ncbi:hypothetical protein GCM10022234_29960 [Aeromicrobium panaciterrae]|uniref:hypothetical protein n=1 Tax=Aeromicrobium panaciterrae TaxID=363861 RepID=UPI0031E1BEEB